jgi:two-component system LytT family response regulator
MPQPWTVVIADDDELSRKGLARAIDAHPRFRIIGEAADGSAAVCLLDQLRPDLAVVDVEMRGLDGLDVLRALRPRDRPRVIFVAEYGDFAVESLRDHSLDFLVRPIGETSARSALDDADERLRQARGRAQLRIEQLLRSTRSPRRLERLPIRRNGRIEVLDLGSVDWISAAGNYVELHSNGRRLLHRITLKHLAERLDPTRFARIHRSTVVNLERVRDLEPTPQGDWKLDLNTGDRLRLSRRYREALDVLLPARQHNGNGYARQAVSGSSLS